MNKDDLDGLAEAIFDAGAIKFGSFKLKLHEKDPEAPLSPLYVDLRILQSFPHIIREIADVFVVKMEEEGLLPDIVSGIPDAAVPIATLVMDRTRIPMITLRKSEKTHGISSKIMGVFESQQEVLLMDDLITKGDSKLEAIRALEELGLIIEDLLVLVDREQGGKEQLAKEGYNLHSIFLITRLLALYQKRGRITPKKCQEVLTYLGKSSG